uniref:Uncharacterized protein n=1 Tax=Ditylenchus dipsaci TaxID=166011 RepID=A0A915DX39_9BILA
MLIAENGQIRAENRQVKAENGQVKDYNGSLVNQLSEARDTNASLIRKNTVLQNKNDMLDAKTTDLITELTNINELLVGKDAIITSSHDQRQKSLPDYEEEEAPNSECEYEKEDDHLLPTDCIFPCAKRVYQENWKSVEPENVANFESANINSGPTALFNSEKDAFFSLVSPGIVNRVVSNTNVALRRLKRKFQGSFLAAACSDEDHLYILR